MGWILDARSYHDLLVRGRGRHVSTCHRGFLKSGMTLACDGHPTLLAVEHDLFRKAGVTFGIMLQIRCLCACPLSDNQFPSSGQAQSRALSGTCVSRRLRLGDSGMRINRRTPARGVCLAPPVVVHKNIGRVVRALESERDGPSAPSRDPRQWWGERPKGVPDARTRYNRSCKPSAALHRAGRGRLARDQKPTGTVSLGGVTGFDRLGAG
jgi:hypothetical protein